MGQYIPELLIVDDDDSTVSLIRQVLKEAGYNGDLDIIIARSAEEAEDKMRSLDRLAGVIVDINLPGQRGEAFVREVRENGRRCGIALMSGDKVHTDTYRFMQKPIDKTQLIGLVKNMLSMWAVQRSAKELLDSTKLLKSELGRAGYVIG